MGVLQHHDAVSGTEKQKVNNEYIKVAVRVRNQLIEFYNNVIREQTEDITGEKPTDVYQTLWNETYVEWGISKTLEQDRNVLLQIYNPGPNGNYLIKVKVSTSRKINLINKENAKLKGDLICGNTRNTKDCELIFNLQMEETSWEFVKI